MTFFLQSVPVERSTNAMGLFRQEEGNAFLKQGKKHYADALDCYTRAINQKSANALHNSVLYGNRAQVNLLLGNYRRAINDAEDAIKLNPANVKVVNSFYSSHCELVLFA
jgi:tetratricopeptide (TPR) repeat protein